MNNLDYRRIVKLYIKDIYRLAYSCCKNIHDAEDILQEVCLALYNTKVNFENDEAAKHWLLKVTSNKCKSLWRTSWKRKVDLNYDEAFREEVYQDGKYWAGADPEVEVGMFFESEEQAKLWKAINKLSSKYSQIVHLYYYEELSVKEISGLLGISESLVTTRLKRARDKIKAYMEEKNVK